MKTGVACLGFLVLAAGCIALGGLICMALWNWVIVALFHVPPVDYWMGVGISLTLSVIGGAFRTVTK